MDEFYGRNMPAPPARIGPDAFVAAAQLYARHARVESDAGLPYARERITWSEIDVVQWTAVQPGARAWYAVPKSAFAERIRDRSILDMIAAAEAAGGRVDDRGDEVAVHVAPAITTTLGGLVVDTRARVLDPDGCPVPGLYAAGGDVGGISTGGYSSGLAAALVLGIAAAESVAGL